MSDYRQSSIQAFYAAAIPEPSTLALLGLAFSAGGLALSRRMRRR